MGDAHIKLTKLTWPVGTSALMSGTTPAETLIGVNTGQITYWGPAHPRGTFICFGKEAVHVKEPPAVVSKALVIAGCAIITSHLENDDAKS